MYQTGQENGDAIRVMVVDDHPVVSAGVCRLIDLEDDLRVVATFADGQGALDTVRFLQPDVILLDLAMPGLDGLTVLKKLRQMELRGKVVLFTASGDRRVFLEAMNYGSSGIIAKDTPPDTIIRAIRKIHEGEVWLDSQTTRIVSGQLSRSTTNDVSVKARNGRPVLSKRQMEIAVLVSDGYRNSEIADKLCLSEQTVKNHIHIMFQKTGVSDRLELALYAIHESLRTPVFRAAGSS